MAATSPRTKECLLCTKHLSRPRHTDQAAKLYSATLIKLFKFRMIGENGRQFRSAQALLSSNSEKVMDDHSHSEAAAEQNFLSTLGKSLVRVSYCADCVHSIRQVNGGLKELHKIQQEILDYKNQVIKFLLEQCLGGNGNDDEDFDFSRDLNLAEEKKPKPTLSEPTSVSVSVQAVRRDIVQGFNLEKYYKHHEENQLLLDPLPSAEFIIGPELQLTRNLTVRLTRLEQTPQMLAKLGHVVVQQLKQRPLCSSPSPSLAKGAQNVKIEPELIYEDSLPSVPSTGAAAYQHQIERRADECVREDEDPFLDADYEVNSPASSCSGEEGAPTRTRDLIDENIKIDLDYDYQLPKSEPRKPTKRLAAKRRIKARNWNRRRKKKVREESSSDDEEAEEAEAEAPKKKKLKVGTGTTKKSSSSSSYPCSVEECKFVSKSWLETYNHTKTIHGRQALKKEFPCSSCSAQFYRGDSLTRHKRKHHKQTWSCTTCSETNSSTFTYPEYQKHINEHHENEPLICSTCSYQAKDLGTLQSHQRLVHKKERNFMCQYCGLDFTSAQRLKYHYGSKHPELNLVPNPEQYKCQHCQKTFTDPPNLRQHIQAVHLKQWKVHCDVCGKGLLHRGKLRDHMISKHGAGEKPFECETCHSKFANKSRLDEHMQRHTGKFRFTCKVCSKGFITHNALKRHEQIHEGILRYFCEICSKGFPVRNYLYIHMRSHETGEERAERLKKSGEKEVPALSKLYNQLRRKNVTTATVQVLDHGNSDSRASAGPQPRLEEYPMIYDYRRERKTISGFVQPQLEEDQQ